MNTSDYSTSSHAEPPQPDGLARTELENYWSNSDQVSFRDGINPAVDRLDTEISSIKVRPMTALGVLSALVLLLVVISGWLLVRMQQIETAEQRFRDLILKSQVEELEQKLQSLDQKVSEDMSSELQRTQHQLSQLEMKLQTLQSNRPVPSETLRSPVQ